MGAEPPLSARAQVTPAGRNAAGHGSGTARTVDRRGGLDAPDQADPTDFSAKITALITSWPVSEQVASNEDGHFRR
jgi:hypothetical protein